jgi:AAA ATPase domain/AAA domain, putative AbiEii toxin, Type IV TA system
MITAITIENFKGISEPVRLELRPITLLFGQNSAGKSSLLHALIYAREVFERHNLNADHTVAAGEHLDLGGFRTFVHDHEPGTPIRLRFELNLSGIDLPGGYEPERDGQNADIEFEHFSTRVETAWVAVSIAWSPPEGEPFVSEYEVGINDAPFACLRCDAPGRGVRIVSLINDSNLFHFQPVDALSDEPYPYFQEMVKNVRPRLTPVGEEGAIGILGQRDALPDLETLFGSWHLRVVADRTEEPRLSDADWEPNLSDPLRTLRTLETFERLLFRVIVGPALLLREALAGFRYIGPLRRVPPRDYKPPRLVDPARWANGMAGWDLLFNRPVLVERVSSLLSDPQRLRLGYTLEQVEFREFESRDPLLVALEANRIDDMEDIEGRLKKARVYKRLLFRPIESPEVMLEPADVGVGISQMIPILAAALDDQPIGSTTLPAQLVAVEHPELNLHPRLQAEIADAFLEGALAETTKGRVFFIETHSEAFTLRFFRRIRESHRMHKNGAGNADGTGDGSGDGSGAGDGDGTGDGRGDGSGAGYGDGTGDGSGDGVLDFSVKPTDVGVWYVDRTTGTVSVKQILVDVEGELVQPWPEGDSLFEQDFRERYT